VVTEAARQISKRDGSEWGRLTIEDYHGTATVLAFGETWARFKDVLQQDAPVLLRGQVSGRERDEEDPPLFLDSAVPLGRVRESGDVGVLIELAPQGADAEQLKRARALLEERPGPAPLLVSYSGGAVPEPSRLRSRSLKVTPDEALLAALRELLGAERVRLARA
jgi:DNA polymerase-3 subunit alpha